MIHKGKKKHTVRFWVTAISLSALTAVGIYAANTRWAIAIATQENLCLPPYRIWLIDKGDTNPVQGEIYAFTAKGLDPVFADGTTIVKVLEGMPGDRVRVTAEKTYINDRTVATGLDVATSRGIDASRYVREGEIADDRYWFFGTTADSFDSRYWGSVGTEQIRGRAYPIW